MALVFRFTDGVTLDSVSGPGPFPGGSPFDTGTAIARPTTRQGIFDAIDAALVAAGYTQHVKTPGQDIVYESNGETTAENFGIELELQSSNRYLVFYVAPKLSAANNLEARIGDGGIADVNNRFDLGTADFTADMFILATKDHVFVMVQNINHSGTVFWASVGLGKRTNQLNPNVHKLATPASSGDGATLDVTGFNPIADGYRPGDKIVIVESDKAETPKAHQLLVVGVTGASYQVLNLPAAYAAGALVGANPQPLIRGVSNNELPDDPTVWRTPMFVGSAFSTPGLAADVLAVNNGSPNGHALSEIHFSSNPGFASSGEFGSGNTPNARTNRFTTRSISLALPSVAMFCRVPNLLAFPGSVVLYPHDFMIADRLSPKQHYVGFRPTSTTTERWCVGPTL